MALGEAPDDPLVPFVALYGIWVTYLVAFDGDMARKLAEQFLSLAEKQDAIAPRLIAHRIMGISFLIGGEIATGRAQLDRAVALYDPIAHRALTTRFGVDARVASYAIDRGRFGCSAIRKLRLPMSIRRSKKRATPARRRR